MHVASHIKRKKIPKRKAWLKRLAVFALICAFAWVSAIANVNLSSRAYRSGDFKNIPAASVAVVFGARVYKDGSLSPILKDRMDAGIELLRAGKVRTLLLSGDNRFTHYNEPEGMRQYARQHGVPDNQIQLDYAGRDTYDTCYRAKHVFGVNRAILVTQQYHAPRATFLARSMGIDAFTYAIPDFEKYSNLAVPYSAREYLVDLKSWIDAKITHRPSRIL